MSTNTTKFEEIYKRFLSQIDDIEFGMIDPSEFDQVLEGYFENSFETLQEMDLDFENIDFVNKDFGIVLTNFEKTIIAKAMALEWVRTRMLRSELMERDIGDRDHNAVQGDKILRAINALEVKLDEDVRQSIINHSWLGQE